MTPKKTKAAKVVNKPTKRPAPKAKEVSVIQKLDAFPSEEILIEQTTIEQTTKSPVLKTEDKKIPIWVWVAIIVALSFIGYLLT